MQETTAPKRPAFWPGGHPCAHCSQPCPPNYRNRAPRKFCSRQCAQRGWARENYDANLRVPKAPHGHPCARCGEPTPEKKVGGKARKFCSRDCAVAANREVHAMRHRERTLAKYGLTEAEYESLRIAQGDRCAICFTSEPQTKSGEWHVDHCHSTGAVRGLLCTRCNVGLGYFLDDPARLASAIEYLR